MYVSLRSTHQRQLLATLTPQELGPSSRSGLLVFSSTYPAAGNPHATGTRSIQSVRTSRFQLHISEKPSSVQTSVTTVRAGLDAGGTGELLGSQFGVCIPPFEAPAVVAGNPHAAGARSIQSVRTSRFQLHKTHSPYGPLPSKGIWRIYREYT